MGLCQDTAELTADLPAMGQKPHTDWIHTAHCHTLLVPSKDYLNKATGLLNVFEFEIYILLINALFEHIMGL